MCHTRNTQNKLFLCDYDINECLHIPTDTDLMKLKVKLGLHIQVLSSSTPPTYRFYDERTHFFYMFSRCIHKGRLQIAHCIFVAIHPFTRMNSAPAPHKCPTKEPQRNPDGFSLKKYTRAFKRIPVWQFQTAQTRQTGSCISRFIFLFYLWTFPAHIFVTFHT
jgi:hypothetical protein